jgi:hypothetical protein
LQFKYPIAQPVVHGTIFVGNISIPVNLVLVDLGAVWQVQDVPSSGTNIVYDTIDGNLSIRIIWIFLAAFVTVTLFAVWWRNRH